MGACKRVVAATGISLLMLLGTGDNAPAQIKLGAVLSVTGPASFLGDPEKKTLEMYVEQINSNGGVNGQKFQLVIYDDGGDAKTFSSGRSARVWRTAIRLSALRAVNANLKEWAQG